eukprot:TRINITY_DN30154_c0_g1_i2.p1 TRINITY_DN30154_c0_g1~~TRINITY_DN30154_c0_g1_i2.p1  ORF type:complete len:133 (-),score=30.48 TRINITY_DN30154_c0_g1_i2:128-526(-)
MRVELLFVSLNYFVYISNVMCLGCPLFDFFFFQAEDGIRDAQESRGLGDVYKRQSLSSGGSSSIPPCVVTAGGGAGPSSASFSSIVPSSSSLVAPLHHSANSLHLTLTPPRWREHQGAVSYTHLTLPTKRIV